MSPEDREQLGRAIADAALLRGSFVLRSGRTSSYYLDKYLFTTRPDLLDPLGDFVAETITALEAQFEHRADRLAGAELGGIPLVTIASLRTGRPAVFVRNQKKDYGTARLVEGALHEGETVILIEDVATSGGQALEAVRSLTGLGARVLGVIAVVDREEGARERIQAEGIEFRSLFTKRALGIDEE